MLLAAAAVAVIVFAYLRSHGAAAQASSSGVDPNAIDPQTGLTYAQEAAAAASGSATSGAGAGDNSAAFDQLNQNEEAILAGLQQLSQGEADIAASIAQVGATLATTLPAPAAPPAPAPTQDPGPPPAPASPAAAPAPARAPAPAAPTWGPPVKVSGVPKGYVIVTAKGGVAVTPQVQQALAAPPKPSPRTAPKPGFVVVA